ncbi:MAG: hypothetical protein OQL28_06725 [Sedimenticola sp.]|nr:hypothetical protein [Sedimenticola sp.]
MIRRLPSLPAMARAILPILFLLMSSGCMTVAEKEHIEALPMYGQPELQRPEFLVWEHNTFVSQETKRHDGDRRRASRTWVGRGMQALGFGDIDGAMRQFNRAWLLDEENYQVYWGFAQVSVLRNQYQAAAGQLDRALALVDDPFQKPALLTDRGTAASLVAVQYPLQDRHRREGFEVARHHFRLALQLDPGYLPLWEAWARACYREGAYVEAWEKIQQARQRGARRISAEFVSALSEKLRRPASVVGGEESR